MTNTPDHTPATPDEITELRAERDRYATAYRKLINQLEQKRIESDEGARAIEEKKVRGKDGQLIPHECAIAISGLAGGYLTATVLAINLFEGAEARTAYMQCTIPQVPEAAGHEGNDPMGAPTLHRGLLERCPAPECEDRTLEQQNEDTVAIPREAFERLVKVAMWVSRGRSMAFTPDPDPNLGNTYPDAVARHALGVLDDVGLLDTFRQNSLPPDTDTKVTVTVTQDTPALQREIARLRCEWPGRRV